MGQLIYLNTFLKFPALILERKNEQPAAYAAGILG